MSSNVEFVQLFLGIRAIYLKIFKIIKILALTALCGCEFEIFLYSFSFETNVSKYKIFSEWDFKNAVMMF